MINFCSISRNLHNAVWGTDQWLVFARKGEGPTNPNPPSNRLTRSDLLVGDTQEWSTRKEWEVDRSNLFPSLPLTESALGRFNNSLVACIAQVVLRLNIFMNNNPLQLNSVDIVSKSVLNESIWTLIYLDIQCSFHSQSSQLESMLQLFRSYTDYLANLSRPGGLSFSLCQYFPKNTSFLTLLPQRMDDFWSQTGRVFPGRSENCAISARPAVLHTRFRSLLVQFTTSITIPALSDNE